MSDKDHEEQERKRMALLESEIANLSKLAKAIAPIREIKKLKARIQDLESENKILLDVLEYVHEWCLQDEGELDADRIKEALDELKGTKPE